MLTLRAKKGVRFCDGLTRRDFLRVGSLAGKRRDFAAPVQDVPFHGLFGLRQPTAGGGEK
jgi:hypothetical protein